MKNHFFITVITLLNLSVLSCTSQDDFMSDTGKKISKQEQIQLLKSTYKMDDIIENVSVPNLTVNYEDKEQLEDKGILYSYQDKKMYAIPFKENDRKLFITDYSDRYFIVENNVNTQGDGDVIITFPNGDTSIKTFKKGVQIKTEGRIPYSFRGCFDRAYDSICDGVIGCAAWYLNALVPATAIAYCAFS